MNVLCVCKWGQLFNWTFFVFTGVLENKDSSAKVKTQLTHSDVMRPVCDMSWMLSTGVRISPLPLYCHITHYILCCFLLVWCCLSHQLHFVLALTRETDVRWPVWITDFYASASLVIASNCCLTMRITDAQLGQHDRIMNKLTHAVFISFILCVPKFTFIFMHLYFHLPHDLFAVLQARLVLPAVSVELLWSECVELMWP